MADVLQESEDLERVYRGLVMGGFLCPECGSTKTHASEEGDYACSECFFQWDADKAREILKENYD